ncbi:S-antigen protein [Apiospora arundinis]|uniref:S-antigen protein n=1 Tax=Apiospora arundinis TaxID=335852 RepID=A0ABR2I8N8_9PEZI
MDEMKFAACVADIIGNSSQRLVRTESAHGSPSIMPADNFWSRCKVASIVEDLGCSLSYEHRFLGSHEHRSLGSLEHRSLGSHEHRSLGSHEHRSLGSHEHRSLGSHEHRSLGSHEHHELNDKFDGQGLAFIMISITSIMGPLPSASKPMTYFAFHP